MIPQDNVKVLHSKYKTKLGSQCAGFLEFDWGYHNDDPKYQELFGEDTILATGHKGLYPSVQDVLQDDTYLFRTDDEFGSVQTLAHCGGAFALVAGQVCLAMILVSVHRSGE